MGADPRQRRRASALERSGRRIEADEATWHALEALSHDLGVSVSELAEEALGDLLRKHRRPLSLKEALRQSTRQFPAND